MSVLGPTSAILRIRILNRARSIVLDHVRTRVRFVGYVYHQQNLSRLFER